MQTALLFSKKQQMTGDDLLLADGTKRRTMLPYGDLTYYRVPFQYSGSITTGGSGYAEFCAAMNTALYKAKHGVYTLDEVDMEKREAIITHYHSIGD